MAVSAAKLEANRRNAQKSTGPRTEDGKGHSKYNAVTHGLTARSVLLPGEDPSQLAARQQQLIDDLQPRHSAEITAIELMAGAIRRSDRSERALGNRINFRLRHEPLEQAKQEQNEAIELGGRLFWQPAFPLPISKRFQLGKLTEPQCAENAFHPHHPARLRLQLEQTIPGVAWLLDRWSDLMQRLEGDELWLSADAFKMVRLMGKHAIDMVDDLDVTRVFLSSLTLISAPKAGPERESFDWNHALIKMLVTFDVENKNGIAAMAARRCEPFARRLAELPLARLAPSNKEQARESLSTTINDERTRLQEILSVLHAIADADQAEAPARLAFETGPEGDRYRRYELTNERLALQSYDRFLRTRNFVVTGRFDQIDVDLHDLIGLAPVHPEAPSGIEPVNVASTEWTVESNERVEFQPDVATPEVDEWQPSARSYQGETGCDDEPFLRNEPTAMSGKWGATSGGPEKPTNEPTEVQENAPNEPTVAPVDVPNEPKFAGESECGQTTDNRPLTTDYLGPTTDNPHAGESYEEGVARRRAARAEQTRKLNEEARREAAMAMATRRAFRRQQTNKNRRVCHTNSNDQVHSRPLNH